MKTSIQFVMLCVLCSGFTGCGPIDNSSQTDSQTNSSNSTSIPEGARLINEGTGRLSFTARRDGRLYLYDLNDRTIVDRRPLRQGQQYVVSIDQNEAQVDGKKVFDHDLKRKHTHQIYFQSNDRRGSDRDYEDGTSLRIPERARTVADGRGEISYRATDDGQLWVYDVNDKKTILSRPVQRGQQLVVIPDKDRVEIDARRVYEGNLVHDHTHRIYFDRD